MPHLLRPLAVALVLAVAPLPALADAIPPPTELDAFQAALIGYWQEENWASSWGRGHDAQQRVIAFGNQTVVIAMLGGVTVANAYHASALTGSWTATRIDDTTIRVTLDQGGGRGTELTLEFDSPDSFLLVDAERPSPQPSRFVRLETKVGAP